MKNLYGPKLDVESVTDIETRKLAGDLTPLDRQVQLEMDKQAMQLRADLLNRGYKGLAWINAGGAAALTTWVQAVWDKPSALAMRPWLLSGITILLFGLVSGSCIFLVQHRAFLSRAQGDPIPSNSSAAERALIVAAVTCFVVGMAAAVIGAFRAL